MKVLLVTSSYKNSWPFLPELREALLKKDITVHVLDVGSLFLLYQDGKVLNSHFMGKLNTLKGGHRFIRFTAKRFIKRNLEDYDAINIHNLEYIYLYLIEELKKRSKNVSVFIWGSDFYRASDRRINNYHPLFKKLDNIGFANIYTQRDFQKRVLGFEYKYRIASFGIKKFEVLKQLLKDKEPIKKQLQIPLDKICVVCGYNAFAAQQHLLLLDQIKQLDSKIKQRIFIILPLTYGGNDQYKQQVIQSVKQTGCNFKSFTGFASDEEIAKIRVVGDIVLNGQISDSFSASLQEHVLCNAILIAGDWLPYQVMTDLGLKYFPVPLKEFGQKLEDVINNYNAYSDQVKDNHVKLYREGIWENRVQGWINLYKS